MKKLLPALFFIAIPLFIIGFIFKVQHLPGAGMLIMAGMVVHVLFLALSLIEISRSQAMAGTKMIWCLLMAGLVIGGVFFFTVLPFWGMVFIVEALYLFAGRRQFLHTKA